jgi:hypothetical protein
MKRSTCLARIAAAASAGVALVIVACGGFMPDHQNAVPPEFQHACGRPGAEVVVRSAPVTVKHADCDLTGVVVSYPGHGGATVPDRGITVANSMGFTLAVHAGTLDLTVTVTGPAGNA